MSVSLSAYPRTGIAERAIGPAVPTRDGVLIKLPIPKVKYLNDSRSGQCKLEDRR